MNNTLLRPVRISVGILTLVFLLAPAAIGQNPPAVQSARTYYVDSVAGNDDRPGTTPANAWKSLAKVNATTFLSGDRILLKSGSLWKGQLWPKGSGVEGHPISLDMYGGGVKPVIQGDGLAEDAVLLKNQEYWEIQNLEITNNGSTPATRRGVHLAVEDYGDAHHVYIRSLTIHDVNGSDVVKHNGGINYTCVGNTKPSRFIDLRIEDNQIYHVDRSGIFGMSDRWERSKWYPSLDVAVRGNVLSDIGGDGIVVVATDGAVVEHNIVGHANQRSEGYNVAIWPWSADNTLVQYNEAYGTKGQRDGEGFDSDWNSKNTIIQYNYSHDNDGGFLLICDDGGQKPETSAGNIGTIVRYNISENDRTRGVNIGGPVKNSMIYNNTIFVGPGRRVDILVLSDWNGWASDTYFYNNIFYVQGTAQFSYGISRAPDGAYAPAAGFGQSQDNVFDSNVYYGNVIAPADPHALTVDPQFVAPGTGGFGRSTLSGYRLLPRSPARGTGKLIEKNGGQDFWGNLVPSWGNADRGASQSNDCRGTSAPASKN
ncbi:MAG TPA: right-handed parallel beta-helix repeat-containing protein [Terriglobia bacterium]|nr:right-handed parallel beta-helix repeat-containing protein [Terriglobia bacterium]